ncbi:hypothetical protein C8R44DRAFT_741160 [Mycena epipterygia]|nr:hypothetical protein C8R44DRAFT_741160 [Mycena epipterygia]
MALRAPLVPLQLTATCTETATESPTAPQTDTIDELRAIAVSGLERRLVQVFGNLIVDRQEFMQVGAFTDNCAGRNCSGSMIKNVPGGARESKKCSRKWAACQTPGGISVPTSSCTGVADGCRYSEWHVSTKCGLYKPNCANTMLVRTNGSGDLELRGNCGWLPTELPIAGHFWEVCEPRADLTKDVRRLERRVGGKDRAGRGGQRRAHVEFIIDLLHCWGTHGRRFKLVEKQTRWWQGEKVIGGAGRKEGFKSFRGAALAETVGSTLIEFTGFSIPNIRLELSVCIPSSGKIRVEKDIVHLKADEEAEWEQFLLLINPACYPALREIQLLQARDLEKFVSEVGVIYVEEGYQDYGSGGEAVAAAAQGDPNRVWAQERIISSHIFRPSQGGLQKIPQSTTRITLYSKERLNPHNCACMQLL